MKGYALARSHDRYDRWDELFVRREAKEIPRPEDKRSGRVFALPGQFSHRRRERLRKRPCVRRLLHYVFISLSLLLSFFFSRLQRATRTRLVGKSHACVSKFESKSIDESRKVKSTVREEYHASGKSNESIEWNHSRIEGSYRELRELRDHALTVTEVTLRSGCLGRNLRAKRQRGRASGGGGRGRVQQSSAKRNT